MRLFTYLLSFVFIVYSGTVIAQSNPFKNKKLPDVQVTTMDGEKVNIADFGDDGKITIINFWATWCGPCKQELENIAELYPEWQEEYNVQLVAVSIDDSRNAAKVKTYAQGRAWEYIVLLDPNQDLRRALSFQAPPFTLLLNKQGEIVSSHTGYREGDEYRLEDEIIELAGK